MNKSGSIRSGLIKICLLAPLIILSLGFAVAKNRQSNTISGKVLFSDTGKPASGTNIVVAGTTSGCVTDKEGDYKMEIKEKARVVFSYVGYKTQSFWFNPGEYRLVALDREVVRIETDGDEVKVSSYGKDQNLKQAPKSAGFQPQIIVDGVKQENYSLNKINPAEIASIKTYDKYGKEGGYDLKVISPPGFVRGFWDPWYRPWPSHACPFLLEQSYIVRVSRILQQTSVCSSAPPPSHA